MRSCTGGGSPAGTGSQQSGDGTYNLQTHDSYLPPESWPWPAWPAGPAPCPGTPGGRGVQGEIFLGPDLLRRSHQLLYLGQLLLRVVGVRPGHTTVLKFYTVHNTNVSNCLVSNS